MYKVIEVWSKFENEGVKVYRCFEHTGGKGYCVQSVDYFYPPISIEKLNESTKQQIELFVEVAPDKRSRFHLTLEGAITEFEHDF